MFVYFPPPYFDSYLWSTSGTSFIDVLDIRTSGSCTSALDQGSFIGQVVELSGTQNIAKCSVNLTVLNPGFQTFFEDNNYIAFSAINCQSSRNQWVFQPYNHVSISDFNPGNTPVYNQLQEDSYIANDAPGYAPYMSYNLFFGQSGVYNLYIYGYIEDGAAYWGFNGDTTDLRTFSVGSLSYVNKPYWTLVGSVYIDEPGTKTLEIYLGDKNKMCLLDQICWVYESVELTGDLPNVFTSHRSPLDTLSVGPFTVALRFRNLHSGLPYSLEDETPADTNVTTWLSSLEIPDSGEYNFCPQNNSLTKGVNFTNGLCLEYWQVNGDINNYAAWNYDFTSESLGSIYSSTDYGLTLT